MISTSKQRMEHPFAGQNTQHFSNKKMSSLRIGPNSFCIPCKVNESVWQLKLIRIISNLNLVLSLLGFSEAKKIFHLFLDVVSFFDDAS